MKIAICLSGQIRTWKQCYKTWFDLIDSIKLNSSIDGENVDVDFFVHTWNFNTLPPKHWDNTNYPSIDFRKQIYLIPQDEIDDMLKIIKPIKFEINDFSFSENRVNDLDKRATLQTEEKIPIKGHISWAAPQLYGIMRAAMMKREFELENKFEYDICVRLRFDLPVHEYDKTVIMGRFNLPLDKKTLYTVHSTNSLNFPHNCTGDIFYFANSETYDVVTSLYEFLPFMKKNLFKPLVKIEEILGYYLRMFQIRENRLPSDLHVLDIKSEEDYKNYNKHYIL